ncbi:putative polyvalent protein kinase domain-containing protein [Cognataquiflexum aquatile]|uniref:putative polyvalent protein kinase domain-containing protein n=1 Tax=Cognataquiflexum aquatile TaxID=2249427 RepID=UPI0018E552E8|nr:hypothetical protein [Cognataquiflexum aquatile]
MQNPIKHELHHIISGKGQVRFGTTIQTVSSYLGDGTPSGPKTEIPKHVREQETEKLERFIFEKDLWIPEIDFSRFVSQGAEQRVFLQDSEYVLKLNDGIYFSSWKEYFTNLLLHNFFFPDTAYELIGFIKESQRLYAVVRQSYVSITENTDLEKVKIFMESNDFVCTRNNDYFNPKLGIILEDLHDENVLTRNGILYFIDTVFYLDEGFWFEK